MLAEWDARARPPDRLGRRQGAVLQPPDPGAVDRDWPKSAISLIENDVGGGFGNRGEFYPEDFLIPFAARHVGRPVKWTEDRREHLIAANHARESDIEVEIACRRDGTILALRGHGLCRHGRLYPHQRRSRPAQHRAVPFRPLSRAAYRRRREAARHQQDAGRHLSRPRAVRGAISSASAWSTWRRANSASIRSSCAGAISSPKPTCPTRSRRSRRRVPRPNSTAATTASRSTAASRRSAGSDKQQLQGRLIDGRYHGIAVSCFIEGGAAGPKETARLALEPDGRVTVAVGSAGVGQGLETAFAQIAADALELPLERIAGVLHGSTTLLAEGYRRLSFALHRHGRLGDARGGGGIQDGAARRRRAPSRLRRRRGRARRWRGAGGRALGDAGGRWPTPGSPPTAASPTITTPTPMARTRRMSRSIRAPGRSRSSIMPRSRMSGASSIR